LKKYLKKNMIEQVTKHSQILEDILEQIEKKHAIVPEEDVDAAYKH